MTRSDEDTSPTGWWVAELVERYDRDDADKKNGRRRTSAQLNTIVLKASSRDKAYAKAMEHGRSGNPVECVDEKGRTGKWTFLGLSSLLPVYDPFDEDGSEILWNSSPDVTADRVQSWVKKKSELEAFESRRK